MVRKYAHIETSSFMGTGHKLQLKLGLAFAWSVRGKRMVGDQFSQAQRSIFIPCCTDYDILVFN